MFIIGVLIIVVGLVLYFLASSSISRSEKRYLQMKEEGGDVREPENDGLFFAKYSSLASMSLGALLLMFSCLAMVPPGHVGVPVLFGAVQEKTLPEGLSVINPLMKVYHMSGRTQTYSMSGDKTEGEDGTGRIVALSQDGLRIPMDVSVVYRLDKTHASWVLQNISNRYENIVIKPATRTAVRVAASNFKAQEAYATKRVELANVMREKLTKSIDEIFASRGFDKKAIHIDQIFLRDVDLPDRMKASIEDKLKAEQDSLRMDFVITREAKEAERKEIEAKGIQRFQEIVKKGIDENLLRWKGIEATQDISKSPNSKIVIIGGKDGMPVILNPQ